MGDFEKLRTTEGASQLPKEFVKKFEEGLAEAIEYWKTHGRLVDSFEDDKMELSFSKGFLAGCIFRDKFPQIQK